MSKQEGEKPVSTEQIAQLQGHGAVLPMPHVGYRYIEVRGSQGAVMVDVAEIATLEWVENTHRCVVMLRNQPSPVQVDGPRARPFYDAIRKHFEENTHVVQETPVAGTVPAGKRAERRLGGVITRVPEGSGANY